MEKPKNVNPTMERRASPPVDFDAGCPMFRVLCETWDFPVFTFLLLC
jgi:hypothetical protein